VEARASSGEQSGRKANSPNKFKPIGKCKFEFFAVHLIARQVPRRTQVACQRAGVVMPRFVKPILGQEIGRARFPHYLAIDSKFFLSSGPRILTLTVGGCAASADLGIHERNTPMLVLARRLHEKVLLPTLDISIQVVALQGNMVRLGIDAPRDVAIYREEVYDPAALIPAASSAASSVAHDLRNRLNILGISLSLLQRQLPDNLSPDATATLSQLSTNFAALKAEVQGILIDRAAKDREPQLTT
jgi:carbon storage regulator